MASLTSINKRKTLPYSFLNNSEISYAKLNSNFRYLEDTLRSVANDPLLADRIVKLLNIGKGWKSPVSTFADLLVLTGNEDGDVRLVKTGNGKGLYTFSTTNNTWTSLSSRFWKFPVNAKADLPGIAAIPPNENGDVRVVLNENRLYKWNSVSNIWEPIYSANLTGAVDTVTDLKALPTGGLTVDEMKLVRQTHDIWRWDGNQWINLTPETIINFLENSDFTISTIALTGTSTANRQTVDSWFIKTGNPSNLNQVTDSEEIADLTKIKFGNQSLKIITANVGGPVTNIGPSNPVRIYQRFTGDKALQFKEQLITFAIWIHGSNNSIKPYIILSTNGTNTTEIFGPSIQNTLVFEKIIPLTADISALATIIGTPFNNNAYIEIGVKIEAQGTYYLDGSIIGQGEIYSLEYTPNFSLNEIVEARQLKSSLFNVLGLLSNLQTPIQTDFVSAINSIITYDVSVDNAVDFISAVNNVLVKSIFIKNGTYNISEDLEVGSKYIIGESKNGVIINFSNGFGFTIYGDTGISSDTGTIDIDPSIDSKKINGTGTSFAVGDVGKYIFIGINNKIKVPYKIAAVNSSTDLDLVEDYFGPSINISDLSTHFIIGLKEDTLLKDFTVIGSKGLNLAFPGIPVTYDEQYGIIHIIGSKNTKFNNILIKDNGNNLISNLGLKNNYSYDSIFNDVEISCSRIGILSHKCFSDKYINLKINGIRQSSLLSTPIWIHECSLIYFYEININNCSSLATCVGLAVFASHYCLFDKFNINELLGSNFTIQTTSSNIFINNSKFNATYNVGTVPIDNIGITSATSNIHICNNYISQKDLFSSPRRFINISSPGVIFEDNIIDISDITNSSNDGVISLLTSSDGSKILNNKINITSQIGAVVDIIWSVSGSENLIDNNTIIDLGLTPSVDINGIRSDQSKDIISNNRINVSKYGIFSNTGGKKLISNNYIKNSLVGIRIGDTGFGSPEDTTIGNKFENCTIELEIFDSASEPHYNWNDPEIANAKLLYNNKEWTARNKIINYPFTDNSDLDNGNVIILKTWIYGLFLFGCKADKQYYISRINNNGLGGLYEIEITEDGGSIIAAFSSNILPSNPYIELTARNNSLIYGFILADFNLMTSDEGAFNESYILANTEILKDLCYTIGLKNWQDYNKFRKYPFIDIATYSFTDNVFVELLLFETLLSQSYYVKSILKDLTNNIYTIEIARTDGTVVSKFNDVTQPTGFTLFTAEPGHTVTGFAEIDWTKIANTITATTYTLPNTQILKKNLIITSSSVDEWETENQSRKFPFTILSSMTNGSQAVGNNWFWSAKLYGCNLSTTYFISRIKTSVSEYIIEITDEFGNFVASWTSTSIPSNDYIELNDENLSGITGYMLVDFSAMPITMDEMYLIGDLDLLPDLCILGINQLVLLNSFIPDIIVVTSSPYQITNSENNKLIGIDSNGSSKTAKLPSSPNGKFISHIKDIGGVAGTNNITIDGNGKNIDGASSIQITTNYGYFSIAYYPQTDSYYTV